MKLGFGFHAEQLGLLTLRYPALVLIGIIVLTATLVSGVPSLRFEGDVLRLMDQDTESWQDFQTMATEFPAAMPDVFVLAKSETRPPSPQWLGRLQDLQLDLQLLDNVAAVQSVFSLRKPDGKGGSVPLLNPFDSALQPDDLDAMAAQNPLVPMVFRPEQGLALFVVSLTGPQAMETAAIAATVAEIKDLFAQAGIDTRVSGRSVAQVEVSQTIQRDLLWMVALSILVGWVVGFVIFSDFRAVMITNIVATTAMIWTAGFYAIIGVSLDSATVILPLLAAIIAFADAVHIVVPLQRRLRSGDTRPQATDAIIRRVGPATALTSMTTAVAFGSLALAGGGLVNMAIMGVAAVILAWVAVMTLVPLLCLALARAETRLRRIGEVFEKPAFWRFARRGIDHRRSVLVIAVLLASGLALAQTQFRAVHRPMAYFPADSEFLQADRELGEFFSGSSTILVRVPLPVAGDPAHPDNLNRLSDWHTAIAGATDEAAVMSRATLDRDLVALLPADAADMSPDSSHALIAVRHNWNATDAEVLALKSRIRSAVALRPGGSDAVISGVSVAISEGATTNIDRLRNGLFLSAFLSACLIALASRSVFAGIGTGLAVQLSILLVLAFGALPHGQVEYGLVVALIISVGIAIDDSIHLVNYARHSTHFDTSKPKAYGEAIEHAGAAIVFSSVILIASLAVTQAADMPAIRSIGRQIMSALAVALVLTLIVVPSAAIVSQELWMRLREVSKRNDE